MFDMSCLYNKKIAIFGTGLNAIKCIYYLKSISVEIAFCLNNDCEIEEFCGYSVFEPDEVRLKDTFVLVSSSLEVYSIISNQLQESGRTEFVDYIYYEWLYKKIVLLHGNCHMEVIKSFLLSSDSFCCGYSIYPNPLIHHNKKGKIDEIVLKKCDVWIHEDIQPDNEFGYYLSDDYLRCFIRKEAIDITVPNLYGFGKIFLPQSDLNRRNRKINNGKDIHGMFLYADRIIDQCVEAGMDKRSIIEFCMSENAIEASVIEANFKLWIDKMRKREENWNIKIVDYILENYKEEKMFYDTGHPTNNILMKISLDVLERLGISDKHIYTLAHLSAHEVPVYPAVKKVLGIKWKDGFIRKGVTGKKAQDRMDFREYIEEYLWWCYGIDE